MGDFYTRANASALYIIAPPVRSIARKSEHPLQHPRGNLYLKLTPGQY